MRIAFTISLLLSSLVSAKPSQAVLTSLDKAADLVGIPQRILRAVCMVESSLRTTPSITHTDGSSLSHGLCQIKMRTALWVDKVYKHKMHATRKLLADPYMNALYAAKYLRLLYLRYKGSWPKACTAYNKGHYDNGDQAYWLKIQEYL